MHWKLTSNKVNTRGHYCFDADNVLKMILNSSFFIAEYSNILARADCTSANPVIVWLAAVEGPS